MSSFQSDLMKLLQGANHVLCPIGWDDRKDDQIISGVEERETERCSSFSCFSSAPHLTNQGKRVNIILSQYL